MPKLSGLTENTTPAVGDQVIIIDDPGGTPLDQKLTITNLMTLAPLVLFGAFFNATPADATTYYFGIHPSLAGTTSAATRRIYMPRAGTIETVDVQFQCTTGSNETSTLVLRKNNTSDTTITTAIALDASPYHELKTGLNITVAAGDYVEFKWTTPTWATNPTAVYAWCWIVLK
jgi:hypothetical protein